MQNIHDKCICHNMNRFEVFVFYIDEGKLTCDINGKKKRKLSECAMDDICELMKCERECIIEM